MSTNRSAIAIVKEWYDLCHENPLDTRVLKRLIGDELAARDAVEADLRGRVEAAETKLAKIEELATPFVRGGKWVRVDDHPPTWYEVSVEVAEACLRLSRRVAQAEEQLRETLITAGRERERAERAEAERDKARETCNRLNKRCQSYEAGLAEKIQDGRDRSGWGLGRMLANAAASMYEADVRRLREALEPVAGLADDEWPSNTGEPPRRIVLGAREALAATALKGGK